MPAVKGQRHWSNKRPRVDPSTGVAGVGSKRNPGAPPVLLRGAVLYLPSGNTVRLIEEAAGDWLCEHTRESNASGETWYTARFLVRFGRSR